MGCVIVVPRPDPRDTDEQAMLEIYSYVHMQSLPSDPEYLPCTIADHNTESGRIAVSTIYKGVWDERSAADYVLHTAYVSLSPGYSRCGAALQGCSAYCTCSQNSGEQGVLDCQDEVGDKPSLNVEGSLLFVPGCTNVVCRPNKKLWVLKYPSIPGWRLLKTARTACSTTRTVRRPD
jgi:hypothetical protein